MSDNLLKIKNELQRTLNALDAASLTLEAEITALNSQQARDRFQPGYIDDRKRDSRRGKAEALQNQVKAALDGASDVLAHADQWTPAALLRNARRVPKHEKPDLSNSLLYDSEQRETTRHAELLGMLANIANSLGNLERMQELATADDHMLADRLEAAHRDGDLPELRVLAHEASGREVWKDEGAMNRAKLVLNKVRAGDIPLNEADSERLELANETIQLARMVSAEFQSLKTGEVNETAKAARSAAYISQHGEAAYHEYRHVREAEIVEMAKQVRLDAVPTT